MAEAELIPSSKSRKGSSQGLAFDPVERRKIMALWFFAHREATAEADRYLAGLGLNRTHFRVLFFVGRMPGITVGQLIEILGLTQQAVSKALGRLITDRMVLQTSGETDRRQRHLKLSKEGARIETTVVDLQAEMIEKALEKVGPGISKGFPRTLQAMITEDDSDLLARMFDH